MDMEDFTDFHKAGKIHAKAIEYAKNLVKIDASILEVADKTEEKIKELGGELAFPAQFSRNEIAAHYCPAHDDESKFEKGDLVKIDLGIHVNGAVADGALTVDLGNNSELVKASQAALDAALKLVAPGTKVSEIGKAIQNTIESFGFKPVRNLSGHGIGRMVVHGSPSIPNYDTKDKTELEVGDTIAIEPFASDGAGLVVEGPDAHVMMLVGKKPVRSMMTRKVLKEIEKYNGLPFASRWIVRKFSEGQANYAFRDLHKLGVLKLYPPLIDKDKGMVSQAEHSVIVKEKPEIFTKVSVSD